MRTLSEPDAAQMTVEDVYSRKIFRTPGDRPITTIAKMMTEYDIGAILVDNDAIVTKGDIISRVIAFAQDPGVVSARDVCSRPLITCTKDTPLEGAMELMAKNRIERLIVVEGNSALPVGYISANDILRVSPSLLTIKRELWMLWEEREEDVPEKFPGYCDDCKDYGELQMVGGYALCSACQGEPTTDREEKVL
ncbi:MAG: cyclic nucleotide-binding/CBS domain-containing protein [Candidatus Heimdallarchaeota archaeon]